MEWRTQLNTDDALPGTLILGEGTLFASLLGGRIVAVDANTGQVQWRQSSRYVAARVANSSFDTVIADGSTDELYGIDGRDGEIRWERSVGSDVDGYFSTIDDVFIHGDEAGDVHARSVSDGSLRWRTSALGERFEGIPVIANNTVVVGTPASEIVALDLDTGDQLWYRSFAYSSYGDVGMWPAVGQSTVFAIGNGNGRGHVQSIDVETGTLRWERDLQQSVIWAPTVYDDRVLISGVDTLYALSPETGEELWARQFHQRAGTIGTDSGIYVMTDTSLRVLDPETGESIGSTLSIDYGGQPVPSNERIYVPTGAGEIVALAPGEGGLGLWPEGGVLGAIGAAGLAGAGYWLSKRRTES